MRTRVRLWLLALAVAALATPAAAQTYTISPPPFLLAQNNSGQIINSACIWTYTAGTLDAVTTYADASGTQNSNPIRSDSAGRFTAFLTPGQSYKFVYESACTPPSHGTTLRTADNISAMPATGVNLDVTGTVGENVSAGAAVYLSDGSGGKNVGQWYNATTADSYSSSSALTIGFAVSAVTSGSPGSIRIAGRVSGLAGLSAGSRYYVSTAGGVTSTEPVNSRFVGAADSATSLIIAPNPAVPYAPLNIAEGRLTATTGTPVTTGDVSAATAIYYTPYKGGRIALYDGTSRWNVRVFTELTISITTCTASKPYDVFIYDNSGVPAAEILVWTSATARATALTTQNGVLVKTGATTRRYVGTFYCNATGGQTDDTFAKRYIWNYYNRVTRPLRVLEATDSWTYTTATWRQANAAAGNQLDFIIGVSEDAVSAQIVASAECSCAADNNMLVAVGLDSTSAPSALGLHPFTRTTVSNIKMALAASWRGFPGVGRHVLVWLETGGGSNTVTWYGDGGGTDVQTGIAGDIEG